MRLRQSYLSTAGDEGFTPLGHKLRLPLRPNQKTVPETLLGTIFWLGMRDLPLRGINFSSTLPSRLKDISAFGRAIFQWLPFYAEVRTYFKEKYN